MPFTEKDKESVLKHLREVNRGVHTNQISYELYEQMKADSRFPFSSWKDTMDNDNFPKRVQCEIAYIANTGLHIGVEDWGPRCLAARLSCSMTQQAVARELISPRTMLDKVEDLLIELEDSTKVSLDNGAKSILSKLEHSEDPDERKAAVKKVLEKKQNTISTKMEVSRGKVLKAIEKQQTAVSSLISKQEHMNQAVTVDLFYLEAFSLIYKISPLLLLGEKSKLTPAIYFTDGPFLDVFINALYHPENEESIRYLHLLTAIGVMPEDNFQRFWAALHGIPSIQKHLKTVYFDPELSKKLVSKEPEDLGQPGSQEFLHHYVYLEALCVARDLEHFRMDRLRCLAQLAVIKPQPLQLLEVLLKNGDFLKKADDVYTRVISRWDVDPVRGIHFSLHPVLEGGKNQPASLWPPIILEGTDVLSEIDKKFE